VNNTESKYAIKLNKYILSSSDELEWIEFKIKNLSPVNKDIIKDDWKIGRMKVDFTEMYSSSFERLLKMHKHGDLYVIKPNDTTPDRKYDPDHFNDNYTVVEELIEFTNNAIMEYYLLKEIKI